MSSAKNSPNKENNTVAYVTKQPDNPVLATAAAKAAAQNVADKHLTPERAPPGMYPSMGK